MQRPYNLPVRLTRRFVIPPPNPAVADWPVVGKPIYSAWQSLNANLENAVLQYRDQIILIGDKLLGAVKSVASNFFMMILSIIISGILLANTEKSEKSSINFASRLMGQEGDQMVSYGCPDYPQRGKRNTGSGLHSVCTDRCQPYSGPCSAGRPVGFACAGFCHCSTACGIVAIPIIIYCIQPCEPIPATLWSVLILIFAMLDNVLKPWLMGRALRFLCW